MPVGWTATVLIVASLALAGCAAPNNTASDDPDRPYQLVQPEKQPVLDSAAAIRIASRLDHQKFTNENPSTPYRSPRWHAALDRGIWHVWMTDGPDEACARYPMATKCRGHGFEIAQADEHTRGVGYLGDAEY